MNDARQPEVKFLHSLVVVLSKCFGNIASVRVKTLSDSNLMASRLIKREKASLSFDAPRSKSCFLKFPIVKCLVR